MIEVKVLPSESPLFYWQLARDVYENKSSPQEHKIIKKWEIYLNRCARTNELVVTFRGIKNSDNWKDAIAICSDPNRILESMEKVIDQWQKKHGAITAFVGHSAGGFFASRAHKEWNVHRITWNTFEAIEGPLNFRTKNDPLTKAHLEHTITICEGGHSIYDFEKEIKVATWGKLLSLKNEKNLARFSLNESNEVRNWAVSAFGWSAVWFRLDRKEVTYMALAGGLVSGFLVYKCIQNTMVLVHDNTE